jgi:tetratricopeptide (TPR) repeat protein
MLRATRSARLKRLHEALSIGHPVSLESLILASGAERKVVVADLRHLRSDLGAPLRFADGGYRYMVPFELPVLAVCLAEFELEQTIDTIGQEVAWSARHLGLDTAVQVRARVGGEAASRYAETLGRSLARMLHPGILPVYDRGVVDAATANSSDGQLETGMNWLAVPAGFDTDLSRFRVDNWKQLFDLLLTLIEAAGYAHSHGAYLLRVDPSQVLGMSRSNAVVLTHIIAIDELDSLLQPDLVGACYQAPERNADWHCRPTAQEDLYALGSLCWFLISNEIPHGHARSLSDLVERQLAGDPSNVSATFSLPKGFRNWLAMMRAPTPTARFASLADARASLLEVDRLRGAQRWQPVTASIPTGWQRSWSTKRNRLELVLGMNLLGLRPLPMVARQEERNELWASLHGAVEGKNVTGCILRGDAGVGKSRLLSWIKHRAVETGAGDVIRIRCSPSELPGHTLSRLIMSALGFGTKQPELSEFQAALKRGGVSNHYEQDALASLVAAPQRLVGWPEVRFKRSEDRFTVLARMLQRLSRQRARIILIDDAQWAFETLVVIRHLFAGESQRGLRIFFVIATREPATKMRSLESRQLAELAEQKRVSTLNLLPLRSEDMLHLLRDRLGMVPDLAARATEWCGGSPMMAHQLLESWLTDGALTGHHSGIAHRDGQSVALPVSFARLWTSRLDQVMHELTEPMAELARQALEVAALLGRSVDGAEWAGACRELGFEPPETVIEKAVSAGLLWRTKQGWRFQHGTLRDALIIESEEEGRIAFHHRAIATFLQQSAAGEPGLSLRCGEHRRAAGDHAVAFELLLKAEGEARAGGDDLLAERALDLAQASADGLPDQNQVESHVQLVKRRADILRVRGDWPAAFEAAEELEHRAQAAGDSDALIWALRIQGQSAFEQGNYDQASTLALSAQLAAQEAQDLGQTIHCELLLGMVSGAQSHWDQAITFYEAAKRRIEASCPNDHVLHGECLFHLGMVHQTQGNLGKALPLFISSLHHWERCGEQRGMAAVANALADAARAQGRDDRALDWYRRAKKVYESVGAWEALVVRLNISLVLLLDGHYEEAHQEVVGCVEAFRESDQRVWVTVALILGLPGLASRRDWQYFDQWFEEGCKGLAEHTYSDPDLARVFEVAGELAEEQGESRRADQAFLAAADQWRLLERPAEANAASLRAGIV